MTANGAIDSDTAWSQLRAPFWRASSRALDGMSPQDSQLTYSRAECAAWAA
jgi:hypothetical protein